MSKKTNTRTIDFISAFCENGELYQLTRFVNDNSKDLNLLFRGNSSDKGTVVVYYNNHIFWKIDRLASGYNLIISFDHARKHPDNESIKEKVIDEFKFIETNNGYYRRKILNNEKISYDFFRDFFLFWKPIMDYYYRKVKNEKEKIRQQELFNKYKETKDGYFIYDLEYASQHENKKARENDKDNNKPDFLAIRFENSIPQAIVIGEVKTTSGACEDTSGVIDHLKKMIRMDSRTEEIIAMKKDAAQILSDYKKMGLYNIKNLISEKEALTLSLETLFIFTDESKEWLRNNLSKVKEEYKDFNYIEY